jgi:small subunit ribosomal protein S2
MIKTPSMQELLEAGVHFGHQVRRGHPRMKDFIHGSRDGVHIIDLAKTEDKLKEAVEAAYNFGKNGKVLLLVGTKKQSREIVETLGKEAQTHYITSHWIGGLLTNFEEVRKNLKKLNDLKEEEKAGSLTRYTKKERLLISRKLLKNESEFGGIADMGTLPDALFIVDSVADQTAVKEAIRMSIPMIAFSDTNANPDILDYPIPANDDGIKSIKLVCETVIGAYIQGKKEAGIALAKTQAKEAADAVKEAAKAEELAGKVAEEAAAIEEEVEQKIVDESSGKAA